MVDVEELHVTELEADHLAPDGTWSGAPSIAASTVAMTNTTEYVLEIGVTGGTYTVFKKNGVTLTGVTSANQGTVPFRFRLKPGDTFAITYSVAPTLQWVFA